MVLRLIGIIGSKKKYSIIYNFIDKKLGYKYLISTKLQDLYCLSENFLDESIKEVGENELIEYFKE